MYPQLGLTLLSFILASFALAGEHHHKHVDTLWSGGEHSFLGNAGFQLACEVNSLDPCPWKNIPRKDGRLDFDYGDLVALGDFYAKAEQAYKDHRVGTRKRIIGCFDKEKKIHETQKKHPEVDYPDCTWVYVLNEKNYIKLASTNVEHFGWHNVKEYIRVHTQALDFAKQGFAYREMELLEEAEESLKKALFYNAFADHFLTDAFPAGHIRVPRAQLVKWAKKNLRGPRVYRKFVGDAFANLLHNSEGKNREGREVGFLVQNSRGDRWRTQSDEFLFAGNNESDPAIALPVEAVAISVGDILQTYYFGLEPTGVFPALHLVPFPVGPSLSDKYKLPKKKSARKRYIKQLKKSLTSVLRWFTRKKYIQKMIENLPKIAKQFSKDVRNDLKRYPQLRRRMPNRYKDAFRGEL